MSELRELNNGKQQQAEDTVQETGVWQRCILCGREINRVREGCIFTMAREDRCELYRQLRGFDSRQLPGWMQI